MRRVLLCALLWTGATCAQETSYAARPEVQDFIASMSTRHDFDREVLQKLFAQARYRENIIKAMTPQAKGERSWLSYRANFVNARRIEAGQRFLRDNEAALQRAEMQYGVPRTIIAAIIGVETEYGRNMGVHRVLDALATLSFDYPRRAEYFRGELEEYLLLSREQGFDAAEIKGSYAGAIGLPQFMPGSVRRYAVDFDEDGRRDLRSSPGDAIGSVANFLAVHGWKAGTPAATAAQVEGEDYRPLMDGGVTPKHPAAAFRRARVNFDADITDDEKCVLIELDSRDAPSEYRVGLHNFYVLTRYNRSSFYASAVLDLAEALKQP